MLNLGIRAHDIQATTINELIQKLQHWNLKHVQLAPQKSFPALIKKPHDVTPGLARYFRQTLQEANIHISVLGCYINMVASEQNVRQDELAKFYHFIHLLRDFDASMIATETGSVGTGYTTANFTDDAFCQTVQSVELMLRQAEKCGATIAIEAGQNHPIHTPDRLFNLIQTAPNANLRVILDCANLMSPENAGRQEQIFQHAIDLLGDRIVAIHLKDFILEANQIKFVPLGQGDLNLKTILTYVKHYKPHIHVLMEATPERYLTEAINHIHQIYDSI